MAAVRSWPAGRRVWQSRQAGEGLTVLTEALEVAEKTGQQWYDAELYRLKGELLLQPAVHRPQSENPNTLLPTFKRQRKPKHVFSRPLRSRGGNRQSHGSCE